MNLIETLEVMAYNANRYRPAYCTGVASAELAAKDREAIETVRAMQEALIEARSQLQAYYEALYGEDYNWPKINDAIAKATGSES
jgi:hypothetical protein